MTLALSGDSPSFSGTFQGGTLTLGTAQNTTSGTAIDFTGIPSWVKRITVMFNGVSTNGSANIRIQIGSLSGGGLMQTSGYSGYNFQYSNVSVAGANIAYGFDMSLASGEGPAATRSGSIVLANVSGNIWVATGSIGSSTSVFGSTVNGTVTSPLALDRVRLTTANGTDTFDAGSVNILYEG